MMVSLLLPRHHQLGLAGGAEEVGGHGQAVSQLVIAKDVMRLLGPGGPELGEMLVATSWCARMSPPPNNINTFYKQD